jgi:hypothetical protein
METSIENYHQYLFKQFQDDLDLAAFVSAYNSLFQGYLDYANGAELPIYSGLSGALLDWVGASFYGLERPLIGNPSGAIYNAFKYNTATYGSGSVSPILSSDDAYKRILTWMNYRGDGWYSNPEWLKRRVKRFIVGVNGAAPFIDNTDEISVQFGPSNSVTITINNPSDKGSANLACTYLNSGVLVVPYQYQVYARSI